MVLVSLALGYTGFSQTSISSEDSTVTIQLPQFDLGLGWSFLMADVSNSSPAPSPALQLSYGLSIRQPILPFLNVALDFSTGRFFGEKALGDTGNINYQTSIITQDLKLTYEAAHLFKKNTKGYVSYQPYVGVGVGLVSWRAKGDLKDAGGNTYHYWSDGLIRNLPESPSNVDQAVEITRDNIYEGDLRDANIDGFGRYDQMALHIPIELGFRYQFTKRVGAHIKGIYHLNFTDLIDNITSESLGDRVGSSGNDNHISAMFGLSVFLGEYQKPKLKKRERKKKEPKADLIADEHGIEDDSEEIESESTENAGEGDSVDSANESSTESTGSDKQPLAQEKEADTTGQEQVESTDPEEVAKVKSDVETTSENSETQVAETNLSSEVEIESQAAIEEQESTTVSGHSTSSSKNATSDGQKESNSASIEESEKTEVGSVESTELIDSTESKAEVSTAETSNSVQPNAVVESAENEEDSQSSSTQKDAEMNAIDLIDKMMEIESVEPKIAGSYHWADLNEDRYISADEVLHFIDLLFDGESKYTVPMIHELIEYYFDQD